MLICQIVIKIMNLTSFKINSSPPTVYYIPNFITQEEETEIFKHVYAVPKPKWTCLSNRRLQDYGGVPHKNGMIPENIPVWLQNYMDKVSALGVFGQKTANHVLINEYLSGQGIMPHTDGPIFYPTVTTINCGSHTILEFCENNASRDKICDILLEPHSLIVLQDDMYKKYLHFIREVNNDCVKDSCVNIKMCTNYEIGKTYERTTRISLTIRHVPKVCKAKFF